MVCITVVRSSSGRRGNQKGVGSVSSSKKTDSVHEHDALIEQFFSSPSPDWNSPEGEKVASIALDYCRKRKMIYKYSLDEDDLHDLCQNMIMKIMDFTKRGNKVKATNRNQFLAFCKTTLKNLFKDVQKSKKRIVSGPSTPEVSPIDPSPAQPGVPGVDDRDFLNKVMEAIGQENPNYVEILEMKLEYLTVPEMMQRTGLSRDGVYKRLERARTAFRKYFESFKSEN